MKILSYTQYQELFAVSQALPGPASTKLAYAICLECLGFVPALLAFTLWSLPGAFGMFGLALGIAKVKETLPTPVYWLLSGLNSATVGLIALAGMQLSIRSITDTLSRTVLIFSACAGLCYTALWYFPVLMTACGIITIIWDLYLRHAVFRFKRLLRRLIYRVRARDITPSPPPDEHALGDANQGEESDKVEEVASSPNAQETSDRRSMTVGLLPGIITVILFFAAFITLLVVRAVYQKYVVLRLFSNMVLAGEA